MRRFRWMVGGALCLVVPLFSGCVITLGPGGDTGGSGETAGPSGGVGGGDADAAQRARQDEVDQYIAHVIYKDAPVVQSLTLPSGDIVDGLDRSVFPALPYALPQLPWDPADISLLPGVSLATLDVDLIPELSDLAANTAVFTRPTFWPYVLGETDATSIEDYIDRYEPGGVPQADRRYAGLVSNQTNRGVTGYMNQFQPKVESGSFSLIEFAVWCPADNPTDLVGAVISVNNAGPGGKNEQGIFDGLPRLHVEYAHIQDGKAKYTWDERDGAFKANPYRNVRPGQVVPVSALGGAQVEHILTILQVPPAGDWWIMYDQFLLGYYPASLFTTLNGGACRAAWYGEALRPDVKQGAPKTEMGSGKFADVGRPNVAYVRKPVYYDTSWLAVEPADLHMSPEALSCYTRTPLSPDPATGDKSFNLGGPGGNDPACTW